MSKVYAIMRPASFYKGSIEDLVSLWGEVYHAVCYETIDGYSLGHEVTFHASLEEAKNSFPTSQLPNHEFKFFQTHNLRSQEAILELELDEESKVMALGKLHKLEFETLYEKPETESDYFKKYFKPLWVSGALDPYEVTSGALTELNRQYHLSELSKASKATPVDVLAQSL